MKKMGKRSISTILIMVLLISLMPQLAQKASAAVNLAITQPSAATTSQSNPSNVTTKLMNIQFQYSDISDTDLSKVFYEIKNYTTGGAARTVKDNPPVKMGSNQAVIQNVELTEGLNSISIILDSSSQPRSLPLWLNYTEVTTVSGLKIDGRSFVNGIFVPASNTLASGLSTLFVEGTAPNAAQVMGYSTMTPAGIRSNFFLPTTGLFSFSTGENATDDLKLRPGDNEMTIVGSNAFKTYRSERKFVYNNGKGFLYNTKIKTVAANNNLKSIDTDLFRQPTLEATNASGTYTYDITTDVKINRDSLGMTHDGFDLGVGGAVIHANFSNVVGTSVTVDVQTVTGNVYGSTVTTNHTVDASNPEYYLIKNVKINNVPVNGTSTQQDANITFNPIGNYSAQSQGFKYSFVNEHDPYVYEVSMEGGQAFYSGMEISIMSSTFDLNIDTVNDVDEIRVYLPNSSTSVPIATSIGTPVTLSTPVTPVVKRFKITLDKDQLPEGTSLLRFVPSKSGIAYTIGAKEFLVNYNPSPYVYVTNIFNGKMFKDAITEPKLIIDGAEVAGQGPVLQMIPVNIPSMQYGDIRVRLNDKSDKIRTNSSGFSASRATYPGYTSVGDVLTHTASNQFTELRFQFGARSHSNRTDWALLEGLNEVFIEVYAPGSLNGLGVPLNGALPITSYRYELFYFTTDLPQVSKLDLEPAFALNAKYTQVEGESFRYYTQDSKLQFQTSFAEADTVDIKVTTKDASGAPLVRSVSLKWNGSNFVYDGGSAELFLSTSNPSVGSTNLNGNGTMTSRQIDLLGSGTNVVEVTSTNKAGNFATRIMEIVREPSTFVMHYPRIDQNPITKQWVGRINGNYTRIYLEAEGATKVIYGKKEEITQTQSMVLNGSSHDVYIFEVKGLKKGDNKIEFTIMRGTREDEVTVTLVNADIPVPGAEFKESIAKSAIKAFNGQLELKFPKGTVLMRNNPTAVDQYLAPTRDLLVAIADPLDGRVNKYIHPANNEISIFPRNSQWESNFARVQSPSPRFRKISPLYWLDGGYIPGTDPTQGDVLGGSGIYPYELNKEFYMRNAINANDQFIASQTGELKLSYDPNMVQSSWRYVTVYHYGYNENYMGLKQYEWKNLGGTVDPKKNTITVPIQEFGYYVVMYMDQSFDDIIGHPWARNYLDTLYSKGMMLNKDGQRFETNEAITRGEFATLLVKAYNLPLNYEGAGTFSDVSRANPFSQGLYEYKYIETAARAGIVRGSLQKRFQPGNTITREEAAAMIARAGNFKLDTNETKVKTAIEKEFTDATNFESYAMPSVLAVAKGKLMEGKPSITNAGDKPTFYFDPKANMTRAEASTVMMKVLLREKKIPSL